MNKIQVDFWKREMRGDEARLVDQSIRLYLLDRPSNVTDLVLESIWSALVITETLLGEGVFGSISAFRTTFLAHGNRGTVGDKKQSQKSTLKGRAKIEELTLES